MVEPVTSTGFAETLAREIGVELLPLHPLESLTPEQSKAGENFISLMEANLESLSLALGCNT
jgi:zinc transport system substrate-binding protein